MDRPMLNLRQIQSERKLIRDKVFQLVSERKNRCYIGFPGERFILEKKIAKDLPTVKMVGLEYQTDIYNRQMNTSFVKNMEGAIVMKDLKASDYFRSLIDPDTGRYAYYEDRAGTVCLDFCTPVNKEVIESISLCLSSNLIIHNGVLIITIEYNRCSSKIVEEVSDPNSRADVYKRNFITATEQEMIFYGYKPILLFNTQYVASRNSIMMTMAWKLVTRKRIKYTRDLLPGYTIWDNKFQQVKVKQNKLYY